MNFDASSSLPDCRIIVARPDDVDKAFHDLKRDMNPEFVHVFLDKIQRYSAKPDRALFLAEYQEMIIAFATIIDHSPAPKNSDQATVQLLKNYACGTGLMVLPEFRHKGVASRLVQHWETWTEQNKLDGIWVVTRQMADWYQRCFDYSVQGSTFRHGVKKTILIKSL